LIHQWSWTHRISRTKAYVRVVALASATRNKTPRAAVRPAVELSSTSCLPKGKKLLAIVVNRHFVRTAVI